MAFSNLTENDSGVGLPVNDASVYSELDDVDHYDVISPSTSEDDGTAGYMVPVEDGSPGPLPYYMVPLPTPPPMYYNTEQQPMMTGEDPPTGWSSSDPESRCQDAISPTAVAGDETGYMVPVDDGSPRPVPVPSPLASYYNVGEEPHLVESAGNDLDRGPTGATNDKTAYMVPVEGGSPGGPASDGKLPLSSSQSSKYNDVRQQPSTTAVVDSSDCTSPDANSRYQAPFFEGGASNNRLVDEPAYTPLQLHDNDVDSPVTHDAGPVSCQYSDNDDYLTPVI